MKKLRALAFRGGLSLNAWLTRGPLAFLESQVLTPFFVRLTQRIRGRPAAPVASSAEALGKEWERLLANRRYAHVTSVDAESQTAHAEITGVCPLRGTGDVEACHRLMAYDRGLLAPHGGRLVVLASQAEPGRTTCRLAIRPAQLDHSDLVAAHERSKPRDPTSS